MVDDHIEYISGFKHQLNKDFHIETLIRPLYSIETPFVCIDVDGNLLVKRGFAWNGTSGPIWDTAKNLRASAAHDALYRLMRQGYLSFEQDREIADRLFQSMMKADGVWGWLAKIRYKALELFGASSADPDNRKKIMFAPKRKKV